MQVYSCFWICHSNSHVLLKNSHFHLFMYSHLSCLSRIITTCQLSHHSFVLKGGTTFCHICQNILDFSQVQHVWKHAIFMDANVKSNSIIIRIFNEILLYQLRIFWFVEMENLAKSTFCSIIGFWKQQQKTLTTGKIP